MAVALDKRATGVSVTRPPDASLDDDADAKRQIVNGAARVRSDVVADIDSKAGMILLPDIHTGSDVPRRKRPFPAAQPGISAGDEGRNTMRQRNRENVDHAIDRHDLKDAAHVSQHAEFRAAARATPHQHFAAARRMKTGQRTKEATDSRRPADSVSKRLRMSIRNAKQEETASQQQCARTPAGQRSPRIRCRRPVHGVTVA